MIEPHPWGAAANSPPLGEIDHVFQGVVFNKLMYGSTKMFDIQPLILGIPTDNTINVRVKYERVSSIMIYV
eukprot:2097536-Karenia_brevis.AAC.1